MNFDPNLALKLANLVQNAEKDTIAAEYQCEGYIYYKNTSSKMGYIASEDNLQNKNYYIILIGAQWEEAIAPGLTAEIPMPGLLPGWGQVIQKFLVTYQALFFVPQNPQKPQPEPTLDGLITYINSLQGNLYFAGHSLGGALCVLLLTQITNSNILMYNFGCTRVGKSDFATTYDNKFVNDNPPDKTNPRSFRVANTVDPALKYPYGYGDEYVHIGLEEPFTLDKHSSSKNHEMSTYIEALEDWDKYKVPPK